MFALLPPSTLSALVDGTTSFCACFPLYRCRYVPHYERCIRDGTGLGGDDQIAAWDAILPEGSILQVRQPLD